ncbi:putative ferulic acid Esterase/Feruloyl esterase [Xylariales sp. PMI_506]|nr:putative ferulic acid Esterase/Feruloyl esterase [Xylariales sp. PMI_506]
MPGGSNFTGNSTESSYNTQETDLPAFCRVGFTVATSSNTSAQAEIWLPESWNSRFLTVGNGGFAGGINYPDVAWGLRKGFATVSTNTGHNSSELDASWMLTNPEQTIDWGHRALHFTTVAAKEIVAMYYNSSQRYSYYAGCSTGGRQGLAAAQRYPEDYDGVLAGSAIAWQTHTSAWQTYVALLQYPSNRSSYIPGTMWTTISDEVTKQCDGIDGVTDGVIMDPSKCPFRPETLLCGKSTVNASACLNADQVMNLKRMYLPWLTSNSQLVNPGISPGGEASFAGIMNEATEPLFGPIFYANAIYNDTNWDWSQMSVDNVNFADTINPGGSNAYDPDLRPFEARGGKIIHYHGYADPLIPSLNAPVWYDTINYFYESIGRAGEVEDFYRLFMVPGMGHCSSGVGPWVIDGASQGGLLPESVGPKYSMLWSLVDWTENNSSTAPDTIIGTKYVNDTADLGVQYTRPICPWPETAAFLGTGNVDDADTWYCPKTGVY